MPFFYKNKNQTETQKILDKHKTGEINVYTFSENTLGVFPFSLFSDECVRTSAMR